MEDKNRKNRTIAVPFMPGDPLWYVQDVSAGDGPVLCEIRQDPAGIEQVTVNANGTFGIMCDGTEDMPDTQYACLSPETALAWIRDNMPGCVLLHGKETKALLVDRDGERSVVTVSASVTALTDLVGTLSLATDEPDEAGYFAVYDQNARANGAPVSTFMLDADGNPVGCMFGTFLVLRAERDPDTGLLMPVDVDENILPVRQDDPPGTVRYGQAVLVPTDAAEAALKDLGGIDGTDDATVMNVLGKGPAGFAVSAIHRLPGGILCLG